MEPRVLTEHLDPTGPREGRQGVVRSGGAKHRPQRGRAAKPAPRNAAFCASAALSGRRSSPWTRNLRLVF